MAGDGPAEDELAILLVEDNQGDATLVRHYIQQGSFLDIADEVSLVHVESLTAAREELDEGAYDLLLLDLGLPESSGLETLGRLSETALEMPVVVLTGLDDHETAVEAIQQGAQDYLPKGDLDTDRLMRSVRYAIERHKQETELRRRTEQLEFFNSVLRHDVQNGMDVIRQNAALLTGRLDGDELERAETIASWSDDMIDLTAKVRRMLDSLTGEDRELEPVDLTEVLRDQVDRIASREGVTVDTDIPDSVAVQADEMLSAVFGNVLRNAVEHNDSETPELAVTVSEDDEFVTVRIADDGPGIPEDLRDGVFTRGQSSTASGGFGLFFVATMVDGYGGTVAVEENDPRGTVLEIRLLKPMAAGR